MSDDKIKANVIQLINSHVKREAMPSKQTRQEAIATNIHIVGGIHLKDCQVTVIHQKTIIKSE